VLDHKSLETGDRPVEPSQFNEPTKAAIQRHQPQLLETRRLGPQRREIGMLAERLTSPQRERLVEQADRD
jgi:hypothetical protein